MRVIQENEDHKWEQVKTMTDPSNKRETKRQNIGIKNRRTVETYEKKRK